MVDFITIDGTTLPPPTTMDIQMSDLDSPDTTRNELGVLQRDRIRRNVYKVELSFDNRRSPDIQLIESVLINTKLNVTFPSQTGRITKQMYVGDRKKSFVLNHNNLDDVRWSISFNLIEY